MILYLIYICQGSVTYISKLGRSRMFNAITLPEKVLHGILPSLHWRVAAFREHNIFVTQQCALHNLFFVPERK